MDSYEELFEVLYQAGRLRSVAKRGWEREQQWGRRTVTRWQLQARGRQAVVLPGSTSAGRGCCLSVAGYASTLI